MTGPAASPTRARPLARPLLGAWRKSMPVTKVLTIRGSLVLPALTVTATGVLIEASGGSNNIEWARFREFIDLMLAAKESAIVLGFTTKEATDENQG
jgi:hypothetical protein